MWKKSNYNQGLVHTCLVIFACRCLSRQAFLRTVSIIISIHNSPETLVLDDSHTLEPFFPKISVFACPDLNPVNRQEAETQKRLCFKRYSYMCGHQRMVCLLLNVHPDSFLMPVTVSFHRKRVHFLVQQAE